MRTNTRKLGLALASLALVAVLLGLGGVVSADPGTVYVATTGTDGPTCGTVGSPCRTIQYAIDNRAVAGDTINVAAGTYTENVRVEKRVTIQSQNGASGTIVDGSGANKHTFNVSTDGVNITGFTVKGATAAKKAGVYLDSVGSCTISATTCLDNYYGIYLNPGLTNTLTSNIVISNTKYGIYIDGEHGNAVHGNTVSGNGECGIYVDNSPNTILTENTVNGNGECGINLDGSDNNTLVGNSVTGNKIGVKVEGPGDASTIKINFNNIHGNAGYGMQNRGEGEGIAGATNNWWGADDGPGGVGPGSGDAVTGTVEYTPWARSEMEDVERKDVSGAGGTIPADESPTGGDVSVTGASIPPDTAIILAKYESNPGEPDTFAAKGRYYDVHLTGDTGVVTLTLKFCPVPAETVMYYWDGSNWVRASDQSFDGSCVIVTVTSSTKPNLAQLGGLPWSAGVWPPLVGGIIMPANKLELLAPWMELAVLVGLILAGGVLAVHTK